MTNVLFLCSRNACRSQMAEGFARHRCPVGVKVASAGIEATQVHPLALEVMREVGIDLSGQTSKALGNPPAQDVDVVISLCAEAERSCPVLPGNPERVSWNLPNPAAATGSREQQLDAFRQSRDEIHRLVDDLFDKGYLDALARAKHNENLILDNISEGIIAHDMNRRIFYFNKAAERITGYARAEVIGKDCHAVFPGNFCGGKCRFCDEPTSLDGQVQQDLTITTKDGEARDVSMVITKMTDTGQENAGVLASFRDTTREHQLARRIGEVQGFSGIIGRDHRMRDVFELIRELADSTAPVLIHGESGTGKELVAAAIHNEGLRANKLFVPVNCGALPESLLESELFGHVKGAFTGAIRNKKGRFEIADGGTLFLDEIGDIPPSMQVKLLRVLQEGAFEPVGGEQTIKVDVRLISATNKNLSDEIAAGRFREDLFYRLSVVPVLLPPLRERRADIPLLVDHILKREARHMGRGDRSMSHAALDMMLSYDWPGNVRELQNWIQFALVKCKGEVILPTHLPHPLTGHTHRPPPFKKSRKGKLTVQSVRDALSETGGNRVAAAERLGVARATLYRFLDAHSE